MKGNTTTDQRSTNSIALVGWDPATSPDGTTPSMAGQGELVGRRGVWPLTHEGQAVQSSPAQLLVDGESRHRWLLAEPPCWTRAVGSGEEDAGGRDLVGGNGLSDRRRHHLHARRSNDEIAGFGSRGVIRRRRRVGVGEACCDGRRPSRRLPCGCQRWRRPALATARRGWRSSRAAGGAGRLGYLFEAISLEPI